MQINRWISSVFAMVISCTAAMYQTASANELDPGGSAAKTAIETYKTWMQFAQPDDQTPAIDTDGCLNYALAKMTVRYNLPIDGVSLLDDSYTYYTVFSQMLDTASTTKMQYMADTFSDNLTYEEPILLSGDIASRIDQTYAICSAHAGDPTWCYILQMTTSSGSEHYILTDYVDSKEERLYLLDSGSRYVQYLGDEKTREKGYYITAVHPFHIRHLYGDCNNDGALTQADITALFKAIDSEKSNLPSFYDADHNETINASDIVYLARIVQAESNTTVDCAIQLENDTPPITTPVTILQQQQPPDFLPGGWNDQIFQRQLMLP